MNNKFDPAFTQQIVDFLEIEKPDEQQILDGAMLYRRLPHSSSFLWQNIVRRPASMLSTLRYQLEKELKIRLDGMTPDKLHEFENKTLDNIDRLIKDEPVVKDGDEESAKAAARHGMRADHEELPVSIQQLWENNKKRYIKMKELYYSCCNIEKSCDRYESVVALDDAYKHYKADMKKYDEWQPSEAETDATANAKDIGNARSYISDNRKKYEQLVEAGDEDKIEKLHAKIQERVDILCSMNAAISPQIQEWLLQYDFTVIADVEKNTDTPATE